ncbi:MULTISPECIES: cation diffusion facilitator family transporter [unclassified Brevundimonas]|uniref:cation diffusion facilitator family transporter n=1 Tax=unclassified Brevundimonas TaxID=2622653 RepID=UPI000CFCC42C|nr:MULTISPECIES: cation diffusion facilitator family transporter [unclassified Brevundimonas]PRA33270.1 cation-efflux pump [Brevundimonas sp. MYb27]PQZ83891.1 cation-efflux pump [Brevundimonas sp. MYb31]PRB13820.1 cation-efflux pump [Brevundimonas sp. MYb52]PRB34447.1 cation-efflux pump [Brevundimonas sp. MYb46]PRB53925.1 cation-efflux pump [Brevundimonas sp. MYb33]
MTASSLDAAHAETRRITTLSVGTATILIVMKAFALGASGSVSILATLADSSLDLIASLATFFAVRWAAAPPDEEHRYGHGKAEALAALVQAGLVFASAVFIGWEAVQRIFDPRPVTAGGWAVGVVVVSIAVTLWLVWMQTQALKKTSSLAVAGDRAHYAADLAANAVVLIGVISGAYLGAPGLDAAAGLVVAVWLFWGAISILRDAADHLLDRAAPDADRAAVVAAVLADPRISGVHQLRTRMGGQVLMVQMHVDLEPSLTLEAAHAIVVEAEQRILAAFPHADILIHADPRGLAEPHGGVFAETAAPETSEASAPHLSASTSNGPWS